MESSNEPEWGRQFTFPFQRKEHPFAVVEVMHKGSMGSSRFLGRCLVPLTSMKPGRSNLKWYNLLKRSKRSHVSGSIQVQCICSPPLDDDVELHFRNIQAQESLYSSYGSTELDKEGSSEQRRSSQKRRVTSSKTLSQSSTNRPPSYRLNMDRYKKREEEEEEKEEEKEEKIPQEDRKPLNLSKKKNHVACKMCGKLLRSKSRSPRVEFDSSRFCSRECALFHSAVESKGFTIRAQVGGNLSICTEETNILRRTRELLKKSLESEREALSRLEVSSSPRHKAPESWIDQYSDLTERLAKEFDKTELHKEEDLVESEWHAFENARRRSKRLRQKIRFRKKTQSVDKEKKQKAIEAFSLQNVKATRLPPPWEALQVVMDSAEIRVTLTLDSTKKREEKWIQGFCVLTSWRFVFMETYPEHRANSSEAMSRAFNKLKRNAMSFEQFHKLFARTCGQKPLQMLQVPIGCVKSLECTESENTDGKSFKCLVMECSDMRTIHVRSTIRVNEKGRTRSDTLESISKISDAHEKVAHIHRNSELSESSSSSSSSMITKSPMGSDLETALSVATIQSEKDSQKVTSRPLEMAQVSEIEDSKQLYLFDTRNAQLLTSIHAQLALYTINIAETRKNAAMCCKKYVTSGGEIWSSPYVLSLSLSLSPTHLLQQQQQQQHITPHTCTDTISI